MQSSTSLSSPHVQVWGTVQEISGVQIIVSGLSHLARMGNEIAIETDSGQVLADIASIQNDRIVALLHGSGHSVRMGDKAVLQQTPTVCPGPSWLGRIVTCKDTVDQAGLTTGGTMRALDAPAPEPRARRGMGSRMNTGLMATDTLLPICRGQRIGLFAGSGVGKSTLLARLAAGVDADIVVLALIGERSREVNAFLHDLLPKPVLSRTAIVAATSNEAPGTKKRAAMTAMAAAEHYRDQGAHVLLLFDSLTRFAEAHRETALHAGETAGLHGFPPSTVRVISKLVERAGPGGKGQGDITALFSVLVAGSDMEEPVADMIRGILDGHFILSRSIAERGRYPALDALSSVSRALPAAASDAENALIGQARRLLAVYEEVNPMVRANLYEFGRDAEADRAIALFPRLDEFLGESSPGGLGAAFERLRSILQQS